MADQRRRLFPVGKKPFATWHVGTVRLPLWLPDNRNRSRAWLAVCRSDQGDVEASDPARQEEIPNLLRRLLSRAGTRWRAHPARVQVADPELAVLLEELLTPYGVSVEVTAELPELRQILDSLVARMTDDDLRPSSLAGEGVTVERLRAFAHAAASFYASPSWRFLGVADLIEVEAPETDAGLRFLSLQRDGSGSLFGLMFFPHREEFESFLDEELGDDEDFDLEDEDDDEDLDDEELDTEEEDEEEEGDHGPAMWSLDFEPPWIAPAADVDLWERSGLPWAGGNETLCPVACTLGLHEVKRPNRRQLAFLEGLLTALAATSEEELDSGRWQKKVSTAEGSFDFELALPDLLEPAKSRHLPVVEWAISKSSLAEASKLLGREVASVQEARRLLNESMTDAVPESEAETPEGRAEELLDRAWQTPGRLAVKLARQALASWPDCAEAYILLAQRAPDLEATRELYELGVAAGERVLGPDGFQDHVGRLWDLFVARGYMEARFGLAQTLAELSRYSEAAGHLADLLRLDASDHQETRHFLVNVFLASGRDDEAEGLLDRYREEEVSSTLLAFPRALLTFRREGDSWEARKSLKRAVVTNRFVPDFLLDTQTTPPDSRTHSHDGEGEAALYRALSCNTWTTTPGALDWLRQRCAPPPRPKGRRGSARKKKRR